MEKIDRTRSDVSTKRHGRAGGLWQGALCSGLGKGDLASVPGLWPGLNRRGEALL